ncbi:MAG: metal ABC transporter ATP-binding protein [Candidatus Pacebacteria bacterium]|nr:metal ABC transporter ATP-binding protein [Candidatus Paceibacterota bacterium]
MKESILSVKNLTVKIGKGRIVDDLSFDVEKGDVLAIIGPNGAGKTTLFKALLGIIPYEGEAKWRPGIKIGYVPQRMEIETDIPLTVFEFLKLRESKNFSKERAVEELKKVSLPEGILKAGLGEISVGQRQRILIAWALLGDPDVLLFDEPTADIDVHGQESIYQLLYHLQDKFELTIILISHDLSIVYKYAEKVLCLNHKQICFGLPDEAMKPEQINKLYASERGFYHHNHDEHNHDEHHH